MKICVIFIIRLRFKSLRKSSVGNDFSFPYSLKRKTVFTTRAIIPANNC